MDQALTPAQQAAVLVMSLPDQDAARLLQGMGESTLAKLHEAAETLDAATLGEEQKRKALRGFFVKQRRGSFFVGQPQERFRRVLSRAVGEEKLKRLVAAPGAEAEEAGGAEPREFLEGLPEDVLARVLAKESPRCTAVLLGALGGEKAGRLLNMLPPDMRQAVVQRMVSNDPVPPPVAAEMMRGLQEMVKRSAEGGETTSRERRAEELSHMLATLDRESQEAVLKQLYERDPETADAVERRMFSFDDLVKVDARSLQELLRNVEVGPVAMALKGAPDKIREHIFQNMSQRLRERVEEEREMAGRVPLSKVQEAREEVMKLARRMYREGKLVVEKGDEQYVE